MRARIPHQIVHSLDLMKFQSEDQKVQSVVRTLVALYGWSGIKEALWKYLLSSEVRQLELATVWELEAIWSRLSAPLP